METSYQKILENIINLKIKDTIPASATNEVRDSHKEKITLETRNDYSALSIDAFNKKYGKYINAIQKKSNGTYKKPRAADKKVEKSAEEIEKEQEEKRMQTLQNTQEKYPPNTRFFSCTNKDDAKWHRYEQMPTDEFLEQKKAIPWSGGMIGSAASSLGSFIVVAVHKDYRVIEFEYLYENDRLYNPNF
jgi:hypothetical protein